MGWVVVLLSYCLYGQVQYVESSTGLEVPTMEQGQTEIEFGDVNGDGHPDLVSISDHGSPFVNSGEHGIMVWFGDGSGRWSLFQNGYFGYGGIALGDVNGDGLMDVGYGMHHNYSNTDFGNQILEVALGDGTGRNWTPWDDGLATNGETWGMFGCDFADVDNDGDLDLGSISFGCCAGVHVYLNKGDGTWTQSFGFVGGNSTMQFVFGDVNGDGFADFACGHQSGTVYLGDGRGGFRLGDGNLPPAGSSGRLGLSLGDVNRDGRDDLAFVSSSGALQVWSWVAEGSWQNLSGNLPTSGFLATHIADMDLDGNGDLVAFALGSIRVFRGDGRGNWSLIATLTTPTACGYAAFRAGVDADHNGFPDIVQIAEENCRPFVGGINRPRFFKESSVPPSPWVYPKYPRGGEKWVAGSVRFIEWHAAVPPGAGPARMTLEFSTNGAGGPWSLVVRDAPSNGRYQWRIPASTPGSDNCFLRYTLSTAFGTAIALTPAPFTILAAPCQGDVNGDGVVHDADLALLLQRFGQNCSGCPEDLDGNGVVDDQDLAILLRYFGCGS